MKKNFLTLLLAAFAFTPGVLQSQDSLSNGGGLYKVQFPESDIDTVLALYETLTKRTIIRDPKAIGQPISFHSQTDMPGDEAAQFIEYNLLQHGFAIVPTQHPRYWKLIPSTDGNAISNEFIPILKSNLDLPLTDEVVTFIAPLRHIPPGEAADALKEIVPLHTYGKIVPLNASRSLIITESGATIRRILALLNEVDLRVEPTIDRLFALERASAEEVVTALNEIYSNRASNTTPATQRRTPPPPQTAGGQRQTQGKVVPARASSATQSIGISENAPTFQAVSRSNSVLVVSTPDEMVTIERLIGYLDGPGEISNFIKLQLNYLTVSHFLTIAGDSLTRGKVDASGQITGGENNRAGTNPNTNINQSQLDNGTGSFTSGRGATGASSAGLSSLTDQGPVGPQSLVVGKTLLVADNDHNVLIASGPPEDLFLIEELVKCMDVRPDQIQISAVIAQLTLRDDFAFGIDFLRSLPQDVSGFDSSGVFRSRRASAGPVLDVDGTTDVANVIAATTPGFNMFGRFNSNLDSFISTLENTNRFKVLSRPTVYTINNRRAIIQTGQRIAVPRSTLSSINQGGLGNNLNNQIVTANIDFENVLLRIEVIPLINNDGQITLRINQSNDDVVGSQTIGGDDIPTIGTQALGTTIMVPDGKTVLLGGLISEEDRRDESGLPVFGNLPLIGRVVGSRADNVERQELLVFIQPKVIRSDSQYFCVDNDLIDRARVGPDSVQFSEGQIDNRPSFESREFETPEKRMRGMKNLFQRLKAKRTGSPPPDSLDER